MEDATFEEPESPEAAKSPMAPRHRPRKESPKESCKEPRKVPRKEPRKEPCKEPCKVRTAPLATPLEPPPPLDVTFFGDLFRTQRRLERERRVDRLSNFRIT